jgi:hypothetical protein
LGAVGQSADAAMSQTLASRNSMPPASAKHLNVWFARVRSTAVQGRTREWLPVCIPG